MEAIDKVWEEEAVRFGAESASSACSSHSNPERTDALKIKLVNTSADKVQHQQGGEA